MGFWRKALISVAVLGAWAGVGSALFVLVTPGEERVQALLKEMPRQDASTKQLMMAVLQEAAATQENVAWRKNWQAGGGGGGGGGGGKSA